MEQAERRVPREQIIELGIGGHCRWPKFQVNLSDKSFRNEQASLINFFGRILRVTDIRTVRRNLLQASKESEGMPAEITQYKSFKFFEEATNNLFSIFRKSSGNQEVNQLVESNSDHGYSHQRRLEKLLKEFFKNEPGYRRNSNLLFFVLSQLISMRFHDLLELFPDGKKLHTEGGALLALGFLNQSRDSFNQIVESMGVVKPDDDIWSKIMVSTFITCLYHSKPKLLETIQKNIKDENKISLNDLLTNEFNLSNILSHLKVKYQDKQNFIDLLTNGSNFIKKNKNKPIFTVKEAKDLIISAKVFGAIDKLDSVLPAKLSTARTFITMKDNPRPFFAPIENIIFDDNGEIKAEIIESPFCQTAVNKIKKNQPLNYQDEYYLRLALSEGHSSPDDFSRFLFETQRVDFYDLPEWLMAGFKFALKEKGDFLVAMVSNIFTSGNAEIFQSVYLQAEAGLLVEFLSKYGIPEPNISNLVISFLKLKSQKERDRYINSEIRGILSQGGIEDYSSIFVNLKTLRCEQSQLEETLATKITQLKKSSLINETTARKTKTLLELAIKKRHLSDVDIDRFTSSYQSYHPISPSR